MNHLHVCECDPMQKPPHYCNININLNRKFPSHQKKYWPFPSAYQQRLIMLTNAYKQSDNQALWKLCSEQNIKQTLTLHCMLLQNRHRQRSAHSAATWGCNCTANCQYPIVIHPRNIGLATGGKCDVNYGLLSQLQRQILWTFYWNNGGAVSCLVFIRIN